jgi:transcription antitermination factor NusA-like protein
MIVDLFYSMELNIKKIFSNLELELFRLFHKKIRIYPIAIIVKRGFLFFFVKNEDYFKAKSRLKFIRNYLPNKKILVIRLEKTIAKMVFGFFPDVYIHNLNLEIDKNTGDIIVTVILLTDLDRLIAIGAKGNYIKAVNEIFNKYIFPMKVKCEVGKI